MKIQFYDLSTTPFCGWAWSFTHTIVVDIENDVTNKYCDTFKMKNLNNLPNTLCRKYVQNLESISGWMGKCESASAIGNVWKILEMVPVQ